MSTRLTTHVLDVTVGRPAAGVAFTLLRDGVELLSATTDADGRAVVAQGLVPGRYELAYAVGDHFGDSSYLDVVPVRFGIVPDWPHVHVALLVTPWSYTTYRGS